MVGFLLPRETGIFSPFVIVPGYKHVRYLLDAEEEFWNTQSHPFIFHSSCQKGGFLPAVTQLLNPELEKLPFILLPDG